MESGRELQRMKAAKATLEFLPEVSKKKYETSYKVFMDWRKGQETISYSEDVLMAYFSEISKKYKASTLWTHYSMLRAVLNINDNVDIAKYLKLRTFLKLQSNGYQPKKSRTFTSREINKFIRDAPDEEYLLIKVALIMGVMGACSRHELHQMKTTYFNDLGSAVLVTIPDTKTKAVRRFTITGHFYQIFKKYTVLRPSNVNDFYFFVSYKNGKCTFQKVGINKFGTMGKQIAKYLKLPSPESYTGHCFRRSATIPIDTGGESTTVTNECIDGSMENKFDNLTISVDLGEDETSSMRHDDWISTIVKEEYIDESMENECDNLIIPVDVGRDETSLKQHRDCNSTMVKDEYIDDYMENEFDNLTIPVDVGRDETSLKEHSDRRSTTVKDEYIDECMENKSNNSTISIDFNKDVISLKRHGDEISTTVMNECIDESMENTFENLTIAVDISRDVTSLNRDDDWKSITVKEEDIDDGSMENKFNVENKILSWIENTTNMQSTSEMENWENWDHLTFQQSSTDSLKTVPNNCTFNTADNNKQKNCIPIFKISKRATKL